MTIKKKIILALVAVVLSFLSLRVYSYLNNKFNDDYSLDGSNSAGTITIIVSDYTGNIVFEKDYTFQTGDSLWNIHWKNRSELDLACNDKFYAENDYTCSFNHGEFGYSIRRIAGVQTNWTNSYLQLFKNGKRTEYGVSLLSFKDGDVIKWQWTGL